MLAVCRSVALRISMSSQRDCSGRTASMVSGVEVMKIQPRRRFAHSVLVKSGRSSSGPGIMRNALPISFSVARMPARCGAAFFVSVTSCSVPFTRASISSGCASQCANSFTVGLYFATRKAKMARAWFRKNFCVEGSSGNNPTAKAVASASSFASPPMYQ